MVVEGNFEMSEREQMMLNVTCSSVYWKRQMIQFDKFGKIHVSQLFNSATKRKIKRRPCGRQKSFRVK